MIRHSKINWDCTLIEFIMYNLTILTFNWDCTLIKSEDANKWIESLHWLICKTTTIINLTIISRYQWRILFRKSSGIDLLTITVFTIFRVIFFAYQNPPIFIVASFKVHFLRIKYLRSIPYSLWDDSGLS